MGSSPRFWRVRTSSFGISTLGRGKEFSIWRTSSTDSALASPMTPNTSVVSLISKKKGLIWWCIRCRRWQSWKTPRERSRRSISGTLVAPSGLINPTISWQLITTSKKRLILWTRASFFRYPRGRSWISAFFPKTFKAQRRFGVMMTQPYLWITRTRRRRILTTSSK